MLKKFDLVIIFSDVIRQSNFGNQVKIMGQFSKGIQNYKCFYGIKHFLLINKKAMQFYLQRFWLQQQGSVLCYI